MAERTASIQTMGFAQQRAVGIQAGRGGVQGIQQFAHEGVRRETVDTATADVLMDMGRSLLEPKIQQIQTQQYLQGAQRAAQGEALRDIVDEQPWYSRIFGPSSSVQGARAIAQMKGVDDYLTGIQNDMPELRKLSSAEFGKLISTRMSDFMTGDAAADAAIQTKMVESMGAITKAHTKANFKYTQDNMQKSMTGYMISGAQKLQAQAQQMLDGTLSVKDFGDVKAGFIGNLMPMQGQTPESYWAGIEEATVDALATGNHHAANAVFDSGVFSAAPAEVRKKLIDARYTYEKRTQETAGFNEYGEIIGRMTGLARSGQLSTQQIDDQVQKINNDYSIRFGVDRPLFTRKEFVNLISGNISSIYNRAEADKRQLATEARADRREQIKLDAKAKTEAVKADQLIQLIQGGAGNMAKVAGFSDDEINLAVYKGAQTIAQAGGNVGGFLVRQYNDGGEHVNSLYKNQLQAGMRAAVMEGHSGDSFSRSYGLYKQLSAESGGKAAAMAYLGDDAVRMMKYDQMVTSGKVQPEVAYQLSFGEPLDKSRKSSDKEIGEALVQAVETDQPGWFNRLFTGNVSLSEQSKRVLTTAVGENFDLLVQQGAMDTKQAAKVSVDLAKKDLDVVGKYVYSKGNDRSPVYQMIGSDETTAGRVFSEFLQRKARENGVIAQLGDELPGESTARFATESLFNSPAVAARNWWERKVGEEPNVMIMRLPDVEGAGMFAITVVDTDGKMTQFPMNTREMREFYEKDKRFK